MICHSLPHIPLHPFPFTMKTWFSLNLSLILAVLWIRKLQKTLNQFDPLPSSPRAVPTSLMPSQVQSRSKRGRLGERPKGSMRSVWLGVCECGMQVSKEEIEAGDAVIKCKVAGCETVWVCLFHLFFDKKLTYLGQFHFVCMNLTSAPKTCNPQKRRRIN